MMEKFILYCGLNDKDTNIQQINTVEAVKIVTNICCNFCGGCTISEAYGYWKNNNNEICIEKSLKIEIITRNEDNVDNVINSLKIALNQNSILKEKIISESNYM